MGCASCGAAAAVTIVAPFKPNNVAPASDEPCDYNNENLQDFYNKLVWFKQTGKYFGVLDGPTLNMYLGRVLTSLNTNQKCAWKDDMDKVADLVVYINTLQNG